MSKNVLPATVNIVGHAAKASFVLSLQTHLEGSLMKMLSTPRRFIFRIELAYFNPGQALSISDRFQHPIFNRQYHAIPLRNILLYSILKLSFMSK